MDARNIDGSTPLCDACASGSIECVKVLLSHGAKVNPPLYTASPLHEACMNGKLACSSCGGIIYLIIYQNKTTKKKKQLPKILIKAVVAQQIVRARKCPPYTGAAPFEETMHGTRS